MVITGALVYPTPPSDTTNFIIPFNEVSMEQVAAAPLPPPPEKEIVGMVVYPVPAFIKIILSIDRDPPLLVVMAIALALSTIFPVGDDDIATVGAEV